MTASDAALDYARRVSTMSRYRIIDVSGLRCARSVSSFLTRIHIDSCGRPPGWQPVLRIDARTQPGRHGRVQVFGLRFLLLTVPDISCVPPRHAG
jgi:hypothetical protein